MHAHFEQYARELPRTTTFNGGDIYYVTLSPLRGTDDTGVVVCCTFHTICDPEPTVLWNTIEKHPELRSTLFTQLPLGISQPDEDGDDFSWVYVNRPTENFIYLGILCAKIEVDVTRADVRATLRHIMGLSETGMGMQCTRPL